MNYNYKLECMEFDNGVKFHYFAFEEEQKAKDFEMYLKTHAGRKFCKNHF